LLELHELAEELVVLEVGNFRIGEDVIAVVVTPHQTS
jgi:hypothetical protein